MSFKRLLLSATLLLALAACGSSNDSSYGTPADGADATRTIEITTTDGLDFEPSALTVKPGEVVTFRVTNSGAIPHDFTIGDQAAQDDHAANVASGHNDHEDNSVYVPAGETVELTWAFPESGTVLIGCHQPGHYGSGMTGTITITP